MTACPVPGEGALEGAHDLATVFLIDHVDEIDDDDPTNMAQTQLPGDRLGRLHIGLEQCLFQITLANKAPRVDIYCSHRLGLVKDQ